LGEDQGDGADALAVVDDGERSTGSAPVGGWVDRQ
jgi:hypothetical protein